MLKEGLLEELPPALSTPLTELAREFPQFNDGVEQKFRPLVGAYDLIGKAQGNLPQEESYILLQKEIKRAPLEPLCALKRAALAQGSVLNVRKMDLTLGCFEGCDKLVVHNNVFCQTEKAT